MLSDVSDPLTKVVQLLQPRAVFANLISGRGAYAVHYAELILPSRLASSRPVVVVGHGSRWPRATAWF
jgi:hypothetical protein